MIAPVLVPLDGSAVAERALGPADDLATALDAPLVLFRACWASAAQDRVELELLADKIGPRANAEIGHGFAASAIAKAVQAQPGTIVCMTTRGHGGAGAVLLGGVAEEVLASVTCPVVLVGPEASPMALRYRHGSTLVAGYDGSNAAAAMVAVAADWAEALGLALRIVMVAHGGSVGAIAATDVRARAEALVQSLAGEPPALVVVDDRHPAGVIVRDAQDHGAALVAVAARNTPRGASRVVVGSEAMRVVRDAPVPVLVLPAGS